MLPLARGRSPKQRTRDSPSQRPRPLLRLLPAPLTTPPMALARLRPAAAARESAVARENAEASSISLPTRWSS